MQAINLPSIHYPLLNTLGLLDLDCLLPTNSLLFSVSDFTVRPIHESWLESCVGRYRLIVTSRQIMETQFKQIPGAVPLRSCIPSNQCVENTAKILNIDANEGQ